jgi:ABC-type transport system involved in multi-copper enzyme maturation permease subunit
VIRTVSVVPAAVISKELRVRMRGWRWAGVTTLYIAVLGAITIGFLLQKYNLAPDQSSRAGVELFQALSIFQLFLIVFVTPASLAGAISGERQHRTWDLLMVSRISTLGIVCGKLAVGIAFNLLLIAASLPLFALVFLFGGVPLSYAIDTYVVFVATVLLLGAASLTVSALTGRLVVSFMLSFFVALALAVGLTLLTLYLQAPGQPSVISLAGIPFQTAGTPSLLTPFAQIDPFVVLMSALPAEAGGTILGDLGTVHHAFGLPWQLPLWGAYLLIAVVLSSLLILSTAAIARPMPRSHRRVSNWRARR